MLSSSGNTGISLQQRLTPSMERWRALADKIGQGLHVAGIGIVQAFNAGPPVTVDVQLAVNAYSTQYQNSNGTVTFESSSDQLPLLRGVPLQIFHGGGFSITLPMQAGDEVLVLVTDSPSDSWLQSGGDNNNPVSQELHVWGNAIAIPGPRSEPESLSNYSTDSLQIRSDDGSLTIDLNVGSGQITISAPSGAVNVSAENANVSASQNINVTASQTVTITGDSSVTIANSAKSRDFFLHTHGGVASGSGSTGPVS